MDESLLALDVGAVRIGVARANKIAKIAEPLETVQNDDMVTDKLKQFIDQQNATLIVVGLPQNRSNEDTEQTTFVRDFVDSLKETIGAPFVFQDEADSSKKAEEILRGRKGSYQKEDIDAEAATLILQDYIEEHL